jgi:tetratricopeptide (TPR) repeat protein
MRLALFLLVLAGPAFAQDEASCPAPPDHSEEIAGLIAELRTAPDEMQARGLNNALWELWTDAPDARAQELLDEGMSRRSSYDLLGARDIFDSLVEYCPDYAEGYNQRAFASFLRQDYSAALWDLERTLELNPEHIGALSGKALTLIGLGEIEAAQEALREALALNPWLPERHFLVEPEGMEL